MEGQGRGREGRGGEGICWTIVKLLPTCLWELWAVEQAKSVCWSDGIKGRKRGLSFIMFSFAGYVG